jgi:hypothetical protein
MAEWKKLIYIKLTCKFAELNKNGIKKFIVLLFAIIFHSEY